VKAIKPFMQASDDNQLSEALAWCTSVVGPIELVSDASREHAGLRAAAHRLSASSGGFYLKTHRDRSHWENEAHAYEQWAPAFGNFAPRLLAVHAEAPLALLISELPGTVMEEVELTPAQAQTVWRAAGLALADLHNLPAGEFFGRCKRDGACAGTPVYDAKQFISSKIEEQVEQGLKGDYLSADELAVVRAALALIPAFEGERPMPCHRDYCPANWLVSPDGVWTGVIDFEFSGWDVRAADFSRYPNFDWIERPELAQAFFEGYGQLFTYAEEQQRLVALSQYALDAVVWGMQNSYYGFAADGRKAIKHMGKLLG
jgi:aminoglycoside phosphotransferase (APT) family kinase protein